ncbi:hypothetical protein M9H77_02684 [Catharanthus roseus]|uniref:Uncharacterized protein n=1 Tax=Catharanthus roseus TaxID=4058 RepID=A0ACC0C953_CATRO|nr:hypothetical protein M9H77_02684 [Catharanthus roseus]
MVEFEENKIKCSHHHHEFKRIKFLDCDEAAGPPPSSVCLIAGAAALLQLAVHGSTVARFPSPSTPLVVELGPRKRIDCLRGGRGGNRRERKERKLIFFFFLVSAATEIFSFVGLN